MRRWKQTAVTRRLRSAATAMVSMSAELMAGGFSTRTCLPASRASTTSLSEYWGGMMM